MRISLSVVIVLLVAVSSSAAQNIYVGPEIGVIGIGASAEVDFGSFSASAEAGMVPVNSVRYEQSGTEYLLDTQTFSGLLLANFKPGGGSFAIGAGLYFGGLNGDGEAQDVGLGYAVGDNLYSASEVGEMQVELEFGGVAPAVMLGVRGSGFNFGLGVAFTGQPEYRMMATGPIRNDPQFLDDVEIELEDVVDVFDKIPVMPLLRIGWQFGVASLN